MQKSIFNISNSPLQRKKSNKIKNNGKNNKDVVVAKDISYPVLSPADRRRKEFFGTISLWSDEQNCNLVEKVISPSSSGNHQDYHLRTTNISGNNNSSRIATKSTSSTPSLHVLSPSNNICNVQSNDPDQIDGCQINEITKLRRSFSEQERKSVNLGKRINHFI